MAGLIFKRYSLDTNWDISSSSLGRINMNFHNRDLIWLTKWVSSLVLIAGMALTAGNFYPLNMYMHLTGIIGWLVVALAWHDRSLIMLNGVAALIFINGIIASLF